MNKASLIAEIADLAGIPNPGPGEGSSVYKALFDGVCDRFGISKAGTMPQQAQKIVSAARLPYDAKESDSRHTPSGGGSTVTLEGLLRVRDAVQALRAGV